MKQAIKRALNYCGFQISPVQRPQPPDDALFLRLAPRTNAKFTVALVGTAQEGLHGYGKATPALYFPKFEYSLAKRGITLVAYRDPADALRNIINHDAKSTVFILIYNEVFQRDRLRDFERLTRHSEFRFYNAPTVGNIIGDKSLANSAFSKAGIPVPPLVSGEATSKVFSNAVIGTHAPTSVIDIGRPLDGQRYNAKFIDTVHEYNACPYYVALRALAVTGTMLSAYVRLRPAGEAEASVHAGDTPLNPELISHFHKTLVESNWCRLRRLCEQIGNLLGPGFYAHDILPSSDGDLYVCESGFKFDDQDLRETFWPIASALPFLHKHFTVGIADSGADEIASQCFNLSAIDKMSDQRNRLASST